MEPTDPAPDGEPWRLPPFRADPYPPIADYGLIGDTLAAALVARDGSLDWMCLPDMDCPSIFAAILDAERGGRFFVGPAGPARSTRDYLDGTAVLRTRHETADGVLEVTDFMPLALPETDGLRPARRVLRLVEAVAGTPEVAVTVSPRPDYGRSVPRLRRRGRGVFTLADGRDHLIVQSAVPLEHVAEGAVAGRARLNTGERCGVSLSFDRNAVGVVPASDPATHSVELDATLSWWRDLTDGIDYDGPFRDAVIRSLVTLRLLTFSQSGAVIAAPTTSLPEAIGAGRNYDYRYCWLRDASFVLDAYAALGRIDEARAFFQWLMHATQLSAPELQTLYTTFGRTDVAQSEIGTLEGYRGSAPVLKGNAAEKQLQLDAYGSVMTASTAYCRHGGTLGASERRRLRGMADVVIRKWSLPDDGLWEMPGPRVHNTYSKVMCWAALDAFVSLCETGHMDCDSVPYARERDRIRKNVLERAWNPRRKAFTGAYGRDWLDASLSLMPRMGIIAADDPRMTATLERIDTELGRGAQLRRYADGVDGIPAREGAFTACGFWAADCVARRGDLDAAEARIGELLGGANDLGLMSEQLDPDTGALLGNFPQAFSHAGLIGAALTLGAARAAEAA